MVLNGFGFNIQLEGIRKRYVGDTLLEDFRQSLNQIYGLI